MSYENLTKFGKYFVAYGEFHDNFYNKLIHIICIPTIYYTMMYLYRNFLSIAFKGHYFEVNFPLMLTTAVAMQGMTKSYVCQGLTLLWEGIMYIHQRHLTFESEKEGWSNQLFYVMLTLHIIAWVLQIGGHAIFETPAFATNIVTSLAAPFFVTAEILYFLGWKKQEFSQIQCVIDDRIKTFREKMIVDPRKISNSKSKNQRYIKEEEFDKYSDQNTQEIFLKNSEISKEIELIFKELKKEKTYYPPKGQFMQDILDCPDKKEQKKIIEDRFEVEDILPNKDIEEAVKLASVDIDIHKQYFNFYEMQLEYVSNNFKNKQYKM